MIPPTLDDFKTESDVEQKLLYPLLNSILGYSHNEIWSKLYLEPTQIDKGAGKKYGYFPDYLICIAGLPCVVIEAKEPNVNAESGLREARLYALEVNKRYPAGLNPIKYVISSNGLTLLYSDWDSEHDTVEIKLDQLGPGHELYGRFVTKFVRATIYSEVLDMRRKLTPATRWRPLLLIGGPSRQGETLPPNSFSAELIPILRKYFDPDETNESDEVIERGYCSSSEITQYNAVLEALLKERIPHQEGISNIQTTKNKAESFEGVLKKAVSDKKDHPDPLILLVGSVGAGKSFFLKRYFSHLISDSLRSVLLRVTIDFNKAKDELDGIETWVCEQIIESLEAQFDNGFLEYEALRRYFAPDINKLERGPLAPLKVANPAEFASQLSKHLTEWFNDRQRLAFAIIRYFTKDKDQPFVVIFDNVDRRDRDQQLKVFQTVQWFRSQAKVFTILALRDETYDAYRDRPPLDAFLKPFAFRITAPRFQNVIKKRLELAINYLVAKAPKKLTYQLSSGISIEYPSTRLGEFLIAIYSSVFFQQRQIRLVLEALSGRDTRRALEMFTEILTSGYLADERLFSITAGGRSQIPEWLLIRVLMRTRYRYFATTHGYITNVFELPDNSPTSNNFLLAEVLSYLADRRKDSSSYKIEGYQPAAAIMCEVGKCGYSMSDINWALDFLLAHGLIIADHQRKTEVREFDYVKISASGYFHLRFFPNRTEYISNVIVDTPLNNEAIAKEVTRHLNDNARDSTARIQLLRDYLSSEVSIFATALPEASNLAQAPARLTSAVETALQISKGISPPKSAQAGDLFD